ncbi:MAG TPA: hypothetical protein VF533_09260 [Solirubrobacteraceae bacterium]|jgi:hypothetical protein
MSHRIRRHLTPSMGVALLALFVALSGVGIAATGGTFILGSSNSATSTSTLAAPVGGKAALQVTNTSTTAGSVPLALTAAAYHPPLVVNTIAKVKNLNVDLLDGFDSAAFLRKGVQASAAVGGGGGVVDARNTGSANGVRGVTTSGEASGVYGENTSDTGGFGLAGRATGGGVGVFGENLTTNALAGKFVGDVLVQGDVTVEEKLKCLDACVSGADVTGRVGDAEELDGIDSGGFVQGSGKAAGQATAVQPGVNQFLGAPLLGFLRLSYFCPSPTSGNGALHFYNDSGSVANVFVESGDGNPTYRSMPAGDSFFVAAASSGDSWHVQAQGALGVMTIEIATVNRANDCHAQAQALLTK